MPQRAEKMASVRIPALLARFAVPSILSLVLHAFYNIVDRIFIGRGVGTLGLAGVTLCFPILLLIFGLCLLFSNGAASLISLYLGENRKADAEKVLGTTVFIITAIGLILFISGQSHHYRYILALFDIPPETFPYAADYLKIILMGAPLFLYGFTLNFIIRAEGNPIYPTVAIITGTLVNIALDPLFIFVFSMGTGGAALATIISEAIVALIAIFYMTRKRGVVHIRRANLKIDPPVLKRIAFLGLSPALMNIASSVQCLFLNTKLVMHGGNTALAAVGIIFPIGSFINLFTFGMAAGMQPIVGFNYGAGNFKRVKDTFYYACRVNFIAILFFIIGVAVFAEEIVSLFSRGDSELTALGTHAIRIFLFMSPMAVINILGARYFQATGKGKVAILVGLLRQLVIFIPVLYLFSALYGLNGIWFSAPFTDFIAATVTAFLLTREMRRLSALNYK